MNVENELPDLPEGYEWQLASLDPLLDEQTIYATIERTKDDGTVRARFRYKAVRT